MKENLDTQENVQSNGPLGLIASPDEVRLSAEDEAQLNAWKTSSKLKGAVIYLIFGLYLLIAGIVFAAKSDSLVEIKSDYYLTCPTAPSACKFEISVDSYITGPVFLFVEFKNYIQNTQVYLNTYNPAQLYTQINDEDNDDCGNFRTNIQVNPKASDDGTFKNFDGAQTLSTSDTAYPCGIRAFDHFTDTFTIRKEGSMNDLVISKKNISWRHDRENIKNKNPEKQWLDLEDESLQVWMRPSGLSKFRKTVGRIDSDLEPGLYSVTTNNSYNFDTFDTTKSLVISNLSSTGGKNTPLVASHLATGSIIVLAAVGLTIWHYRKKLPM